MISRRWNVQILDFLDFHEGWEQELREKVAEQGSRNADCAIDLFAWYGDPWHKIPDFAIGRYAWDNWLVGAAQANNIAIVDVTPSVRLTHQSHRIVEWENPDATNNFRLAVVMGGLQHSTHTLTDHGLVDGWTP